MSPILLIVIGAVILGVVFFTVMSIRGQRTDTIEERLGRYTDLSDKLQLSDEFEEEEEKKKKKESALTKSINEALTKRKFGENWRVQLNRADLKLTVAEYLALHVVSMVGLGLLSFFILFPLQIGNLILSIGIGFFLPRFYVNNKVSKRLKEFDRQLPDTLSLWVNSLRAGYSAMQALEAISREAPEPTKGEIRRVVQEVQLGISLENSLEHMLMRVPSEDFDLVITAVNIQREVGGNLAEILEVIGHTIRERIKIKGEIQVLTAQGRITGWLISGLPIALGLFLWLINPTYMGRLIENRGCGWPLLAIGLGMIGIGMTVVQRIVDIDV
ncbi:MAG TPA: type II secretion system F family protein [Aggregatilineales bacterium]|nr:type II secretion system F family protein [Anaerolineales bacterium]HRE47066.1 type II secretion system F family protein [Aggregatilineales bacterium]